MKLTSVICSLLLLTACAKPMTDKEVAVANANCNLLGLTGRAIFSTPLDIIYIICVPPTIVYIPAK